MRHGLVIGICLALSGGVACGDDSDDCSGEDCPRGDGGSADAAAAPNGGDEGTDTDDASDTSSSSGSADEPAGADGATDDGAQDDGAASDGDGSEGGDEGQDDEAEPDPEPAFMPARDGNQGALCESDRDCNMGLACYTTDEVGFCTASCTDDGGCGALTGATYTCSSGRNACRVECGGEDDGDCPAGMECLGNRCNYPANVLATAGAFERCESSADCAGDLVCNAAQGPGPGAGAGFCTQACESSEDCTEAPSSGSIEAGCSMGGTGLCRLDCSDADDGCPDGMVCTNNRCRVASGDDEQ